MKKKYFSFLLLLGTIMLLVLAAPAMAKKQDRNHDKIPDRWERAHHLSLKVKQTNKDQDKDGLKNLNEYRSKTDPRDPDTDNDGVGDDNEDSDNDGVDNGNEQQEHTNPGLKDTNHNGVNDGNEDADHDGLNNKGEDSSANNPVDSDTDNNGVKDGEENSGIIASFDAITGVLVVNAFNGTQASGTVTPSTEIKCKTETENEVEQHGGQVNASDNGSGDEGESGSGNNEQGDDDHDGIKNGDEGDSDNVCSTADLLPGTLVHEANLDDAGTTWHEISLVK